MIHLASYLLALAAWLLATPSWAAITPVQTSTQGSCASAASCGTSFGSLPTFGNAVVATLACWNASAACSATVADNQSNIYGAAGCKTGADGKSQTCIYFVPSVGASSGTFTVTASAAASTAFELVAVEYNSMLNFGAVDASSSGTSTTGTGDTGVSGATTQADELSVCSLVVSSTSTNLTLTSPTGYTRRGVQHNASATIGFESSDKILTATGTQQCTWSHSTAGESGFAAQLVTFKAGIVQTGCRLLQDGTSKRLMQNGVDGRLLQGGSVSACLPATGKAFPFPDDSMDHMIVR